MLMMQWTRHARGIAVESVADYRMASLIAGPGHSAIHWYWVVLETFQWLQYASVDEVFLHCSRYDY